jgi:hypothetical protein
LDTWDFRVKTKVTGDTEQIVSQGSLASNSMGPRTNDKRQPWPLRQ